MFNDRGDVNPAMLKMIALVVIVLLVGAITTVSSIVTIEAGYNGILLQGGEAIDVWRPGWHFKLPFVQTVERMDMQIQKAESTESTATQDLQEVSTTVAVNFRLNPDNVLDIFEDFRHDYITRVIRPAIEESLKATTAKFTAEELITQRPEVKRMLDIELGDRLENIQGKQYFIFVQASLTDFQFSKSFTEAIESKVTQQQRALEAENKLRQIEAEAQQQVIQAKAEKEAAIARAEGEARAIFLRAMAEANSTRVQAEAQSYQIQLINQMIADNPYYIQYEWIRAWDGRLPTTVFGDENIELLLQGYTQGSGLPP
ncbi:prohibitin family protein [Candidatus Bathyarchaeota archaeon]|nr:prohibitin family protein [Candidatus Bathyarchaeota archaeon]